MLLVVMISGGTPQHECVGSQFLFYNEYGAINSDEPSDGWPPWQPVLDSNAIMIKKIP